MRPTPEVDSAGSLHKQATVSDTQADLYDDDGWANDHYPDADTQTLEDTLAALYGNTRPSEDMPDRINAASPLDASDEIAEATLSTEAARTSKTRHNLSYQAAADDACSAFPAKLSLSDLETERAITRISPNMWAIREIGKRDNFYHLWGLPDSGNIHWGCTCKTNRDSDHCDHVEIAHNNTQSFMQLQAADAECVEYGRVPQAALLEISNESTDHCTFWLSVVRSADTMQESANKRVFVKLVYPDATSWPYGTCSICARSRSWCAHRELAQIHIVHALGYVEPERLRPPTESCKARDTHTIALARATSSQALRRTRIESNMPRDAPLWAKHDSDPVRAVRTPEPIYWQTEEDPLRVLPLDYHAACSCGYRPQDGAEVRYSKGVVYDLTTCWEVRIQLAQCRNDRCLRATPRQSGSRLQHRPFWITGDYKELGLISAGEGRIFTHQLLDSYAAHMVSVATPFSAFHKAVSFQYMSSKAPFLFVSPSVFAGVYRSYMALSDVTRNLRVMQCPKCLDNPDAVIIDGYAAGYNKTSQTGSLQPPTRTDPGKDYPDVRPPRRGLNYINEYSLRLKLQKALHVDIKSKDRDSRTPAEFCQDLQAAACVITDQDVTRRRHQEQEALGQSLDRLRAYLQYLASKDEAFWQKRVMPYRELLRQLLAAESILGFCQIEAAKSLEHWSMLAMSRRADLSQAEATKLKARLADEEGKFAKFCPALGITCAAYTATGVSLPAFEWLVFDIARRVQASYDLLFTHTTAPAEPDRFGAPHLSTTGSVYQYQYRSRPSYSCLRFDQRKDGSKKGTTTGSAAQPVDDERLRSELEGQSSGAEQSDYGELGAPDEAEEPIDAHDAPLESQCQKFYDDYKKAGLTGGMLLIWCTHLVCYGFHFFESSEGRNDIFSALYCHFERAPKVVIYDYACALGPYCMQREPEYFKDTLFLIDEMHSKSHTKCTSSAFSGAYMNTHHSIRRTQTSAAEVANACLKRIRVSLAYSSERNAIALAKTFVLIWNRTRINRELAKMGLKQSDSASSPVKFVKTTIRGITGTFRRDSNDAPSETAEEAAILATDIQNDGFPQETMQTDGASIEPDAATEEAASDGDDDSEAEAMLAVELRPFETY
ncbi:uncharacterized protein L969DRAFT_101633 [Mixia osmundae IAM 14324]|uniref:HMG domain-containing protein n=1 Tax=Mixia osmundae (strain CBS 9802 / IAM 14324 / JCM 22182 / KY 12970) TaxID=764103 RepID=G7DY70_MIXOS|nr:uncharacterized protein L969DRAFT_101633 [Mixia osmundae IAM 14324]KEI41433.1 hypothetical protein L969DRAFT_101633 [Mixia osmundae IAM 14324]GAA95530.1 hypothetical protein E5Q_02185 [Mixia osmundae IAM 14324]